MGHDRVAAGSSPHHIVGRPRVFWAFVVVLLCLTAAGRAGGQQTPGAISVSTVAAELRPITRTSQYVGRVEAVERVDIRARVTGFVDQVLFKEGDQVTQGQELYRLERTSFDAAVQQARGSLLEAQGRYANASAQRARTQELSKTDVASRSLLDQRIAAEQAAQGQVIIADANLKTAIVNLGYTEIKAPIAGEVGLNKFTLGNVVGPDSGPLTTIVSRDPMYVTFPVSQREFLRLQGEQERRARQGQLSVRLRFSDGTVYGHPGRINFVDVVVQRATDTVLVRATVPNQNGALIDGQLVSVSVESDKSDEKVLVPQAALIVDQQGPYVFVVENGKAAVRRVKLGGESGPYAILDAGLNGGEQVVVQGVESLRPGSQVIASPAPPPQSQG